MIKFISFAILVTLCWMSLYAYCARLSNRRTAKLRSLGRTISIDELIIASSMTLIVEVNLGYGVEYWAVESEIVDVERESRTILNGKLVLIGDQRPSKVREFLVHNGKRMLKVKFRFGKVRPVAI